MIRTENKQLNALLQRALSKGDNVHLNAALLKRYIQNSIEHNMVSMYPVPTRSF